MIEAEHFIVQVQQRHDELKPGLETKAALCIQLRMGIGVDISIRPFRSEVSAVHKIVLVYIGVIVCKAKPRGEAAFVVRHT